MDDSDSDDPSVRIPITLNGNHIRPIGQASLTPDLSRRLAENERFVMSAMVVSGVILAIDISRPDAYPPQQNRSWAHPFPFPEKLPLVEDWDPINYVGLIVLSPELMLYLHSGVQFMLSASVSHKSIYGGMKLLAADLSPVPVVQEGG